MTLDPWNIFSTNFGHMPMPCTTVVTLLDLFLYAVLTILVTRARIKYKVDAPSTHGPDIFVRIYRTQINMLEQMMLHLPLLWIAALAMDDVFAASFGAIWTFARILYSRGYYTKASRRLKGFTISMFINMILLMAAIVSTLASL